MAPSRLPPVSSLAPACDGLVDPGLDALGGVLADQRADVGRVVGRVAGDLGLDGGDDLRGSSRSYTEASAITRCTEMQDWPAW